MKKLLLISTLLLTGVCVVNAQSQRLLLKPSLATKAYPIQKKLLSNDGQFTVASSQPQSSTSKKTPSTMSSAKLVGYTCYDLASNNSVPRRIINHGDGTFSFAWTTDDNCIFNSWSGRGTGYNYWNGTAFLFNAPNVKIETVRTGFSQIATLGTAGPTAGEVIFAHKGPPYDFIMSSRTTKGSGAWTEATAGATLMSASVPGYTSGTSSQALWGRIATGGADGNSIHLIANYFPTDAAKINGVIAPMIYSRSTDAGQSWDQQSILLPGYDSTRTLGSSAETYSIDAEGQTVAIVQANLDADVTLWKSTDNGTTFLKTFIDSFQYAPTIDSCACTDTAETADGTVSVVVSNGVAHVAYPTVRVMLGGYFPSDAQLVYWNDNAKQKVFIPIATTDVDDAINNGNGSGFYEVGQWNTNWDPAQGPAARYGNRAFLTIPSISVDGNNVFILFSLITDGDSTADGQSFRDLWVVASSDGGATFGPVQNITCTFLEEEFFGSLAKKVDNFLHILYEWDTEPGTNVQGGDPVLSSEVRYTVVDKAKVLAGTAHCSASGLGVVEHSTPVFNVADNYPNPTSGLTYFEVTMKQTANLSLEIFNNLGQQVYTSTDKLPVGKHVLSVDASNFSAGLYFYTIKSGDAVASGKMTVVE